MDSSRPHASNAPLHVLIVGGGIGGLCLAQGLRKSGIGVAVYERDRSAHFKDQGYRIGVKQDGSRALRDCLPAELFDLCVATTIRSATRMVFLDHALNEKFSRPIPPLPEDSFFGVNRLTLREILLAGLEQVVRFGRTFERLDQCDDGRVRAWFADGTSATARLAPSVRLTEIPDYLAWMLDGGPAGPWLAEAEAAGSEGRPLHRLAGRMLAGWPASVRRVVDEADAAATFLVRLRSARPVRPWRTGNVTLLGDAVHTMSPGRGEGANTALRDAELLRHALVDVATRGAPLAGAVRRYEAEMLRYGFQAVADSLNRPFAPRGSRR